MKKLNLLVCFIFMFIISACSDPCKDVNCNDGTCDEGTCLCDNGFEGSFCDTEIRAKFLGTWTSDNLDCEGEIVEPITLTFSAGTGILEIIIQDSEEADARFNAEIIGETVTIAPQEVNVGGLDIVANGGGTLNTDGTMAFALIQSSPLFGSLTCTGTLQKI